MHRSDYVGFLPRAGAWAIDKVLIVALTGLMAWRFPVQGLSLIALWHCGTQPACLAAQWPPLAMALLRWLLPACSTVLFLTRMRATPGKLLLKAEVVDAETGASLTTRQAWLRVFGCAVSYATLGVGHLMIIFDARKQALHDKIAGSVVVWPASRNTS